VKRDTPRPILGRLNAIFALLDMNVDRRMLAFPANQGITKSTMAMVNALHVLLENRQAFRVPFHRILVHRASPEHTQRRLDLRCARHVEVVRFRMPLVQPRLQRVRRAQAILGRQSNRHLASLVVVTLDRIKAHPNASASLDFNQAMVNALLVSLVNSKKPLATKPATRVQLVNIRQTAQPRLVQDVPRTLIRLSELHHARNVEHGHRQSRDLLVVCAIPERFSWAVIAFRALQEHSRSQQTTRLVCHALKVFRRPWDLPRAQI
jgi:hypothetical protein